MARIGSRVGVESASLSGERLTLAAAVQVDGEPTEPGQDASLILAVAVCIDQTSHH
jgi:hypothetical protein